MVALTVPFDPKASPLAQTIDELYRAGYTPLPVVPRDKAPGEFRGTLDTGSWGLMTGWNDYAGSRPFPAMIERWKTWPDANVGVVLGGDHGGYQLCAIDFDTDIQDELDLLSSSIPPSPMRKAGARGWTSFYRAPRSFKTKRYMVPAPTAEKPNAKRTVLEILTGNAPRQTVMPPSMHPHGRAYEYITGNGIVPIVRLPVLTQDHLDVLEDNLGHLGWNGDDVERPDRATRGAMADDDNIWRETNNAALDNLDMWVGALGLPKIKRHGNGSWEAIPSFRASNSGTELMRRKSNLKFHRSGIKDMGTDIGYTAIDVVVAAFSWDFDSAFQWLRAKLGLNTDDDGVIDFEALTANMEAKAARLEVAVEVEVAAAITAKLDSAITWDDRDANKALAVGWLVKKLLPDRGVSLLFGQSGAGKSFVALELAACTITGQPFFGHRIKAPGGVLFALGEASGTMPDRMEAVRRGRFNEQAPADPITGGTLNFKRFPVAWVPVSDLAKPAPWRAFADHVRTVAADMLAVHGRKLRLVIVDTIVASFGFADDPDAAAATKAMKSMDDLAQELDLLFLPVHHAGKSVAAGAHGTYAWTGSAETSIEVSAARDDATSAVTARRITLRKNRHAGNEGWNQPFDLKEIELRVDEDGDPVTSAIVTPVEGVEGANDNASPRQPRAVRSVDKFMEAFNLVFELTAADYIIGNQITRACKKADVQAEYLNRNNGNGKDKESVTRYFRSGVKNAIQDGYVYEASGYIWPFISLNIEQQTAD